MEEGVLRTHLAQATDDGLRLIDSAGEGERGGRA
jgi:hypothetical protein